MENILSVDIPDIKKTKLVMGKCIELASKEIYVDGDRLFKFALDAEDYENDKFETKDTNMYDYLIKPFTGDADGAIAAFKVTDDMERRVLNKDDMINPRDNVYVNEDDLYNLITSMLKNY